MRQSARRSGWVSGRERPLGGDQPYRGVRAGTKRNPFGRRPLGADAGALTDGVRGMPYQNSSKHNLN